MMKVSFVFAENKKWWAFLSPVIMRVQGTDFSHCAIAIHDENFSTIFHSEYPAGYCVDMNKWSEIYKIKHFFSFDVDDQIAVRMMHWLCNQVHKPYSVAQLFLILIYKQMPFARPVISKWILNGDYADICSEFSASFMEKFFAVNIEKPDDLIDLNDVYNAAKELKGGM